MSRPSDTALAPLEQLCAADESSDADRLVAEAKSRIKTGGEQDSRRLASLIRQLVASRSDKLVYALKVAVEAAPTAELFAALEQLPSEPALIRASRGNFAPELSQGKKIGWSEQTHRRISSGAAEALEALRSTRDNSRLIAKGSVQTALIVGCWLLLGLLWSQL